MICDSFLYARAGSEPLAGYKITDTHLLLPRRAGFDLFPDSKEAFPCDKALSSAEFQGALTERQARAQESLLAVLTAAPHVALLCLPCGFGKTVLALSAARALGRRTLIVVHRRLLLWQWLERVQQFLPGAKAASLQEGVVSENVDFAVVLVQTLVRRSWGNTLHCFGTCIFDEVHHAPALTYFDALFAIPCKHVIGLTATAHRRDGLCKANEAFFGPELFAEKISSDELSARVLLIENDLREDEEMRPSGFRALQQRIGSLTLDAARNALLVSLTSLAVLNGRRVLVLTDRRAHANSLYGQLKNLGAIGTLLIGGSEARVPEACSLLVSTFGLAREGLDVPRMDMLLLATPVSDVEQAVGRVRRKVPGKAEPLVVDLTDFLSHRRLQFYTENGFKVTPATRESAAAVLRAMLAERE